MIHMQQDFRNKIHFLVGSEASFEQLGNNSCRRPFADEVIDFLQNLSTCLINDKEAKKYSDIVTFAFWCRKANVVAMKKKYTDLNDRKGRGISFHIAPSNIPVMFAFSLVASLLGGNSNIVRVSSKIFPQTEIICRHINSLFANEYKELANSNFIVSYPHDEQINSYFSQLCDSRIIWGGNRSIASIRESALKPSAIELPFYDRFSFAIIGTEEYLKADDKAEIAEKFYIDTYFTDQNACTSPQLLVWIGENEEEYIKAKTIFWAELKKVIDKKYVFQPIQGVDKLAAINRYSIEVGDGKAVWDDMNLMVITIDNLHSNLKDYRCPGGYFYEYHASSIDEIKVMCSTECQTIAFYGVERNSIIDVTNRCSGVDRVVPLGATMNFGLVWDGFDFITSLSKLVG